MSEIGRLITAMVTPFDAVKEVDYSLGGGAATAAVAAYVASACVNKAE